MGYDDLAAEIRKASQILERGDARIDAIEGAVNALLLKAGRPGYSGDYGDGSDRADAADWCAIRKQLQQPKDDGLQPDWRPTSDEIAGAQTAKKALSKLWRHADFAKLDHVEQKSLSAFSLGNSGWLLPPEQASRAISCIAAPTDVAGIVEQTQISAGSLIVPIDNARAGIDESAWSCHASCFANNPNAHLTEGLGQLEIKAEELRPVVCVTSDLLQDAAFNVESWIMNKVSDGFRNLISASIALGDGVGKPMGVLNPRSGVPVCEFQRRPQQAR
jgi:HK97 family phage major capsid protein